jgi:hypothetical protein
MWKFQAYFSRRLFLVSSVIFYRLKNFIQMTDKDANIPCNILCVSFSLKHILFVKYSKLVSDTSFSML